MNKKTLIGVIVVVVILIVGVWFLSSNGPTAPRGESGDRTVKELENLTLPKVGEEAPEEGVGVPGKIAEGESGKSGQQYWVFETELREEKLDPFEFRLPVGDILGIAIMNSEDKAHTVHISSEDSFIPNFIKRTIAPGGTGSMRTQVFKLGEYDVLCTTCKTQVVGKFVVVPK